MNLSEEQKQKVAGWIGEGFKLSEIQSRLETEFGLRSTYLETRLLVDDLKLMPKDPEPAPPKPGDLASGVPGQAKEGAPQELPEAEETESVPAGGVSVTVDTVARPGALISGRVAFSDGHKAEWFLDQMGRLGLVPQQQGYRPSPADMQSFQMQLERELQKFGF